MVTAARIGREIMEIFEAFDLARRALDPGHQASRRQSSLTAAGPNKVVLDRPVNMDCVGVRERVSEFTVDNPQGAMLVQDRN